MKNDTAAANAPKTTKKQMREAVDHALWFYNFVTGGTLMESLRQAPAAYPKLQAKVAEVARLAANPSKLLAADAHLMDMALNAVPAKIGHYQRYIPGTPENAEMMEAIAKRDAEKATNVIPFKA